MKMTAPQNVIANYFQAGYCFHRIPPEFCSGTPKAVFLIHGWGVRAASMENLARALADVDYTAFNYDYPTSADTIAGHAENFLKLYRRTLRAERLTRKVLFVTHSMGGLLLRSAMAKMTENECRHIEAIVMLGPPNRGSAWARLGNNALVRAVNASLGDMATDPEAFVRNIPAPPFLPPTGIIAGRYDGKVAFRNTALPEGLPFKRTMVNCTHPGLRDPENTLLPILEFFHRKDFRDPKSDCP